MKRSSPYFVPFILVTSLFLLWAFLHNINPILIPHLKKACQLNDTQSALVDTAVYIAYFLVALPAGWFMSRYGYKKAIITGLFLFGAGFLLFIPAAAAREYLFFLIALFIGASGAAFLETAANPYIAHLGDEASAPSRLNFAQSFNGVGAVLAPVIGGRLILSGIEHTDAELAGMSAAALDRYLDQEAATVITPYLVLGIIVFLLLLIFVFTKLPKDEIAGAGERSKVSLSIFRHANLRWAVAAQFFYVGAQACVGSFFIRFSKFADQLPEKDAALLWGSVAMVGFMIGRFAGTFLMQFIRPPVLLAAYAAINVVLLLLAITGSGNVAVYCLVAVPFFMSVMFPTIFAIGLHGLGSQAKIASSFIVMAIVGGAFFPLLMGSISDLTGGNIQLAYIIPMICFLFVGIFALRFRDIFSKKLKPNDPVLPRA